jgi:hypothetical protein
MRSLFIQTISSRETPVVSDAAGDDVSQVLKVAAAISVHRTVYPTLQNGKQVLPLIVS